MQYFKWRVFGPAHWTNIPAPTVTVEIPGANGPVKVEGMFDTGADWTELQVALIDALGIAPVLCAPSQVGGHWRPSTVVEARLDGHIFNLPVTFVDRYAGGNLINLFGRIGLLDQFRVIHNPRRKRTGFGWNQAQPQSAAAIAFETHVSEWLQQNPQGFSAGQHYMAPA